MTFAAAKFWKFFPAAAFALAVEFLMDLANSVVAGQIVGETGLSAINLMQPVFCFSSFLSLLVGTGSGINFATEMGRFDKRRASEMLTQGLWCALGLGAFFAVAFLVLRWPILDSFGAASDVRSLAGDFWLVYTPCLVLEPLVFYFVCMCSADGDPGICTLAYVARLAVGCVVSVCLTMRYGLVGCAYGTGIGCVAALCVLSLHFLSRSCSLRFVRHFSLVDAKRILSCAVGDASIRICQALLFYLLSFYVIARFGSEKLPVVASAISVLALAEVLDCVPVAVQPLVGVYCGERNDRLVNRIMSYAVTASVAIGCCFTVILSAFPQIVVMAMGITDATLSAEAKTAVRIVSVGLAGSAILVLYNSYCMCISKKALAAYVSFLSALAVPAVLVVVLGSAFGSVGVWASLGVAPFVACLVVAATVLAKWGIGRFPLFLDGSKIRRMRVFDLVLSEEAICATAEEVGKFLSPHATPRLASMTSLLVEETLMTVRDKNAGRKIRAEVTVEASDGIGVIERDDGVIFDITDVDMHATSFRSYFVSNLMMEIPVRRNMTTTSFNRNVFRIGLNAQS